MSESPLFVVPAAVDATESIFGQVIFGVPRPPFVLDFAQSSVPRLVGGADVFSGGSVDHYYPWGARLICAFAWNVSVVDVPCTAGGVQANGGDAFYYLRRLVISSCIHDTAFGDLRTWTG